jgi:uncharacterized membrane protein YqiK
MTGADIISIVILVTILIAIGVYLLHWLYRHSSKDQSFVRTGFGGERVVMGGGALVIPIIHNITRVNMNAVPVEIRRHGEQSLITRSKVRIDITAEFFVRVVPTEEAISIAARTLGERMRDPMALKEIVQGRFVDAMAAVASRMTMEEIHTNRVTFINEVGAIAGRTLGTNGLELENASLTSLNQTDIAVFNPANAFDAEGLTQLTEQIEERRRLRNQIENDARINIKLKDFETEQRALQIDRDLEYARIEQLRSIESRRAAEQAAIEQERSSSTISIETSKVRAEQEAERVRIAKNRLVEAERINTANEIKTLEIERQRDTEISEINSRQSLEKQRIVSRQEIEAQRIENERKVKELEIRSRQDISLIETTATGDIDQARLQRDREVEAIRISADREIDELRIAARKFVDKFELERQREVEITDKERLIAVINKSIEEAYARTEAAEAWKAHAAMEEQITSAKEEEIADRMKRVELINASAKTERETMRMIAIARAEREAAEMRALAQIAEANAAEVRYAKDAEGQRLLNESENMRSEASRRSSIYENLVRNLPSIIRETVKPMENIESIKILQVEGLPGLNSPSEIVPGGGAGPEGGNMTDRVVNSAMKYRTQVAFVDGLMKDLGLPIENLGSAGGMSFRNFQTSEKPSKGDDD